MVVIGLMGHSFPIKVTSSVVIGDGGRWTVVIRGYPSYYT